MSLNEKTTIVQGRDEDVPFCLQDKDGNAIDMSNITRVRMIVTDELNGTVQFEKDSSGATPGITLTDLPAGEFTVHFRQADTKDLVITPPDHGAYGAGKGPALLPLMMDIITYDNAAPPLVEQLAEPDVLLVMASAKPDLGA